LQIHAQAGHGVQQAFGKRAYNFAVRFKLMALGGEIIALDNFMIAIK